MSELKTKVEDVSSIRKKIEIEVPIEKVKEVLEREYERIGKNAKLKGFRKGKVPRHLLEKFYAEEVHKEAMERAVRETYPDAVEKEMIFPISAPVVDPGPFDKEKPFIYSATFEIKPNVEIKEYSGMKLEHVEVVVTKEEVDQQIEMIRQQLTQLEPLPDDTKAEKGNILVMDFKGTAGGKPFKGSDAKDFMVEIGAGNMLPEFENVLVGAGKGDERDLELEYPADYFNEELAGKKGKFHIKVKDVRKKLVPELNDEFAKSLGGFNTLEDVKKDIEKRILDAKQQDVKRHLSGQVLEKLVEEHPFEVPQSMTNAELKAMFESFVKHLANEGKKFDDTGMKIDDFIERYKKDAENRVRSFLAVDAIAELEKVSVSDEELETRLNLIASQTNQPLPKVRQEYEKQGLIDGLRIQLRHEKVLDLIIKMAKIKVDKPKKGEK